METDKDMTADIDTDASEPTEDTGDTPDMAAETEHPDDETVVDFGSAEADAAPEDAPLTDEQRILALEAEAADLKDKLLRTLAEAENVRKRAERQVSDARTYAIEKFAGDLLPVSDNLARALEALGESARLELSEAGQALVGGVEMTQNELHAALARHGVVAIDAAPGAAFDPNLHQAVSQIPSDQPSGTVAQPFQNGWKIGDRVLRAAMVAVSLGPAN